MEHLKTLLFIFYCISCINITHALNNEDKSPRSLIRSFFGRSSSSTFSPLASPSPVTSPRSPLVAPLKDCTLDITEIPEPVNNQDLVEYLELFGVFAQVFHISKNVIILPKATITDLNLITPELLKTDLGDISGSDIYDAMKRNISEVKQKAPLVYKAYLAQSIRKKLLVFEADPINPKPELKEQSAKLLQFLADQQELQTLRPKLETISNWISKKAVFDEQTAHDLEIELLEGDIHDLLDFYRGLCIVKPCKEK